MSEFFTGLVPETGAERADRLSQQIQLPPCAGKEVKETLFAEPPSWNRIESQVRTNMCAVHAGTTGIEVIDYQITGQVRQRSRNFLYAKAQTYCGIYGDRGVTLGSVIKAGRLDGCCLEDLHPFTGVFNPKIPAGCEDDAAKCKITATIDLHSGGYSTVRTLIGQNMGVGLMVTDWEIEYEQGYIVEHYRPLGNAGHARVWLFLAAKVDRQGRPYVWTANSHSKLAQHNGYELWSPTAIDEHLATDRWGSTGISGLSVIEPQEVDWAGVLNPFAK